MRIIAGSAKGTRLRARAGNRTRPTLDRVREALFSILDVRVENARVLDLFAGTGALGIEALSRGAAHCHFVESDPRCVQIIEANLDAAKLAGQADVLRAGLPHALARLGGKNGPYELIFADPPYEFAEYDLLCAGIVEYDLLDDDGLIVIEHDAGASLAACLESLTLEREARYGSTCLSFLVIGKSV